SMHIPNAKSEPIDLEDSVLSALLRLAGELALQHSGQASASPVPKLIEQLLTSVDLDPEMARLMEELPVALGGGALLQSVFIRMFPAKARPIAFTRSSENPNPNLTTREREVLMEMAKGRSKKEI